MIRNQKFEKQERLKFKTVDAQFAQSVQKGLNCSPFEAEAIVKIAREAYCPENISLSSLRPGQMVVTVISELEGASKKIKEAAMVSVTVTVDSPDDVLIREREGVDGLRRHRIVRICQEALDQGGLMTVEDLAHRILNVGERTIIRDLKKLRQQEIIVPLRSTIRDIGRTITHKEEIIKLWLSGKQYGYISRSLHHSCNSIKRYVDTFKRTIALSNEGHTSANIAFLIGSSSTLVKTYLALWKNQKKEAVASRIKEVEQSNFQAAGKPAKKGGAVI